MPAGTRASTFDDPNYAAATEAFSAAMREALAKLEPALFQEDDWVFEGAKEPPLVM